MAQEAVSRTPQPDHSWITAAGAVLDAASLWASTVEHPSDPDVQLMIRAGFAGPAPTRRLLRRPLRRRPGPDDPISISHYEYDEACRELAEADLPLKDDLDAAGELRRLAGQLRHRRC